MRLVGPVTIYRPPQCHLRKRSRVERSRGALCPRRSRRSSRQPCEAPWHERDAHEGLFASMSHARRSPRRAPSTQVSCTPLLPNDGRGVQGRELMARAGERDDRDAHEGLLASMSHARRSPLVSRCRLTCRSFSLATWRASAGLLTYLHGQRSLRLWKRLQEGLSRKRRRSDRSQSAAPPR